MLFTSHKKHSNGCLDSNATNSNEFAEMDNNYCCYIQCSGIIYW